MKSKLLFVCLIMSLLLAACSGASAPATQSASDEKVTLSYAIWDANQQAAHEALIAKFEETHPNITVTLEVVPWEAYWNKLQTAVAGGEAYDVFWMNGPNFPVYASKNVLLDLKSYVDRDSVDMTKYPSSLVDLYSYNGDPYGLPKDFDTIALYYNKDLFDAAGLEYPTADWTWDDLALAAEKLTQGDVWGFAAPGDQTGYWNFIYQNGGQIINEDGTEVLINQPAACDALKYLYNMVEAGFSPDAATTTTMDPATQLFPGGKIAMITDGSWMARTYADAGINIGVAPLPQSTQRATIIHGLSNVVWSGTQHPEEAWEFVKFLGSQEAAQILAESGTVIPAYEGMQQTWVDSIPSMDLQVFVDALDYSVPYPTAAQGMEWNIRISEIMGDVWNGAISMDDACQLMATDANAILQGQ